MKRVFICSPFKAQNGGTQALYIDYAKQKTREAIEAGCAPYTPHLYLTRVLDDNDPCARWKGISIGFEFLKTCEEIWVCARYGISTGMEKEINAAHVMGIKIVVKDKA